MAGCLLLAAPAFAENKLGFVDLQKALNQSEAGKVATEKMKKMVQDFQVQVDAKEKELKKLKEDLDKQRLLLSKEALEVKERDLQQKLREAQRFATDKEEELQKQEDSLTKQIIDDLKRIVDSIGEKEGYAFIFAPVEPVVLYADDKIDLTDAVIKAYDASKKATNGNKGK
jgi:outer membrane protein